MKGFYIVAGLLLMMFSFAASAQKTQGYITGKVRTTDGAALTGATVSLWLKTGSIAVQTIHTDTLGYFRFADIKPGEYRFKITSLGLADYVSGWITLTQQQPFAEVDNITVQSAENKLQDVTVQAQKNFVEQKADRTVVNVNALISNTGTNALEVLEKTPGVQVDQNGTITFKGKSGVVVMIDNKPTYLSGEELANFLRSMPASQLDKIELMANPPARYDASGNAGVINIKTKKSSVKGFNGSIAASVGKAAYWRTLETLSLNYYEGKVNLFANLGFGIQNNYRRLDVTRDYFDHTGNLLSGYTETAFFYPKNRNRNLKLGMDYAVTPKTTIGFVFTGAISSGKIRNPTTSLITGPDYKIDSTIEANNYTVGKFTNAGINLNYARQFSNPAQLLTFDLDYLQYDSKRDQSFNNNTLDANGTITHNQQITANLPTIVRIYTVKSDYTHPLKGKAKIETGVKSGFVDTDNEANYFAVTGNNSVIDYNRTNRFLYKENVNAAYLTYSNEYKRFSLKFGLRLENSNIKAHQLGNALRPDSAFEQQYTNLFPTAYLSYKLDTAGSHVLNLSYGRRIDRPYYQSLNPFVTIIDKYSTWVGNPFLRPQFSSNWQLAYHYKSIFSVSLQYSRITDFQTEVDLQEGDVFVAHTLNLGRSVNLGASIYFGLPVTKWWNPILNIDVINNAYKGEIPGSLVNSNMTYVYTNLNNVFTFPKGWGAEFGCFYLTKGRYTQFVREPLKQVNIGFQKKIWNNKGTVKLSVRDVFRSNIPGGQITHIPNVAATYRNDFANRSVTLGFTYNFGSANTAKKKRDTGGSENEQRRVGQ